MFCENLEATGEGLVSRDKLRGSEEGTPESRLERGEGGSWGSDQIAPGRKHNPGVQGRGVAGLALEDLRCLVCWGHKRQQKEPREFQLETQT